MTLYTVRLVVNGRLLRKMKFVWEESIHASETVHLNHMQRAAELVFGLHYGPATNMPWPTVLDAGVFWFGEYCTAIVLTRNLTDQE